MLASAETQAGHHVHCRQIVEGDFDTLVDIFMQAFPHHARDFWYLGLARMAALPTIEGVSRFGYGLEGEDGLVGALLTITSRRGENIISNVSSWYVQEAYRAHATLLNVMATRLKHVTYLNISPAEHTWPMLRASGWTQYNFGRSAAFTALGLDGGKVREKIPADLPERALLEDHRKLGCISVVCENNGIVSPFVFKPRRLAHPPLPMLELIYCRDPCAFERCGAALGRYFLTRGCVGFILDGKSASPVSRYVPGMEPRFYKGPRPPTLNDLAYTERVFFK